MKIRLTLILLATLTLFVVSTQAAFAATIKRFPDGSYAVTTTGVKSEVVYPSTSDLRATTGLGGSPTTSGHKTIWVRTRYYSSFFHDLMISYKTSIYWEWKDGVVINKHWLAPQESTPAPFVFYVKTTNGDSGWQTYNGKYHGLWYGSRTGHFVQQITKLGVIKRWHPLHEYWVKGDGTYTWHAHP